MSRRARDGAGARFRSTALAAKVDFDFGVHALKNRFLLFRIRIGPL